MIENLRHNQSKILLSILCICLFALVRAFESALFYDPFLHYFQTDFSNLPLPVYNSFQLFIGLLFRYTVNMIISLLLLFVLFREIQLIQFSFIIYVIFFVLLIFGLFLVLYIPEKPNTFLLFYIRRFLIQPLLVILFIPAFYYQRHSVK